MDYAASFELLQYQYDRWILCKLTGRSWAVSHLKLDLKHALADIQETPHCCYLNHMKLVDMHRQFGPARFFITIAPGAYGTTWHPWILHQLEERNQHITSMPAAEMEHLMHVLKQTVEKYLLSGCKSPFWIPLQKQTCVKAWAYRIEFQEGTRSKGANAIRPGVPNRNGTGIPHIHLLVWTNKHEAESVICQHLRADLADDDTILGPAVGAQQLSHASSLPLCESTYFEPRLDGSGDFDSWSLNVKHPAIAQQACVRAFFGGLCCARLGHQDVQIVQNAGDVLSYSAAYIRYATKSSSALDASLLDQGTSGLRVAWSMLTHMCPSAAQMAITLQRGSLCIFGGDTKEVHLPSPNTCANHAVFQKYLACKNRSEQLCFVDWLRTYRTDIEEPRPYERKRGFGCAVALCFASRFNDFFCGQWLCAWVPWQSEVEIPNVCERLPKQFRYFHACRLLRPDHWTCTSTLREELTIEGHRSEFIDAAVTRFQAVGEVCDSILAGTSTWSDAPLCQGSLKLYPTQEWFLNRVLQEIVEFENGITERCKTRALLGSAGTGKSAVLNALIEKVSESSRVLVCTPTGALSDVYRSRFWSQERVVSDTFDGMFSYNTENNPSPYKLLDCALIVVDEIGYLDRPRFEFLMRCSALAGHCCSLVVAGDFGQQPPPSNAGFAKDSPLWQQVITTTLTQQQRCEPKFSKVCNVLRHHRPNAVELRELVGNRLLRTADDMRRFFREHPGGILLAGKRETVLELNEEALRIFFNRNSRSKTVSVLERNSFNDWETREQRLPEGSKVILNLNVNKKAGEVNGAMGVVRQHFRYGVLVQLDSGQSAMVTQRQVSREPIATGLPLDLAYACTVAKMQGRTLPAVAIMPDLGAPAVGYTAITRVRSLAHLYWLAEPNAAFFTPAAFG